MGWLRHARLRSDVGPLLDGELSGPRRVAVAAHLRECWACSGEAETLRCVRAALRRHRARAPAELAVHRLTRFADGLPTT